MDGDSNNQTDAGRGSWYPYFRFGMDVRADRAWQELKPTARRVWDALFEYADRVEYTCYPSRKAIAKRIGRSVDMVKRGLRDLIAAGFVVRAQGTGIGKTVSLYTLAHPKERVPITIGEGADSAPSGIDTVRLEGSTSAPSEGARIAPSKAHSLRREGADLTPSEGAIPAPSEGVKPAPSEGAESAPQNVSKRTYPIERRHLTATPPFFREGQRGKGSRLPAKQPRPLTTTAPMPDEEKACRAEELKRELSERQRLASVARAAHLAGAELQRLVDLALKTIEERTKSGAASLRYQLRNGADPLELPALAAEIGLRLEAEARAA